jgi:hypothetical protein
VWIISRCCIRCPRAVLAFCDASFICTTFARDC